MSSFEIGAARGAAPVSAVRATPALAPVPDVPISGAASAPAVQRSAALDPGAPPVATERVSAIKAALRNGTYPLVPTRVADAMIAAGLILRGGQ